MAMSIGERALGLAAVIIGGTIATYEVIWRAWFLEAAGVDCTNCLLREPVITVLMIVMVIIGLALRWPTRPLPKAEEMPVDSRGNIIRTHDNYVPAIEPTREPVRRRRTFARQARRVLVPRSYTPRTVRGKRQ